MKAALPFLRRIAPLLAVLACAVVLRFDAVIDTYGPVERPAWLRATQIHTFTILDHLRPASMRWPAAGTYPHRDGSTTHYFSDPYTYLEFARAMPSFYAAQPREPVFPFATKIALWLLDDQDVAVSVASATFSVLAVLATYLLGARLGSRWIGVAAALALAIEYDAITWSVGGWRDDAFTFGVTISAYAMVRWLQAPSTRHAILLGLCGGFTVLTRLTALTFLIPALIYLAAVGRDAWRIRVRSIGIAGLTIAILAAPYLINCWRVFGDPLYAINRLTHDQLAMEGRAPSGAPEPGAVTYAVSKAIARPFQTFDTVVMGLTRYPFVNKWTPFTRWLPGLDVVLSWSAVIGLWLFLWHREGRLLLLVLATSLVPAALTWRLAPDWRFTEHVYPLFLVASAFAGCRLVTWIASLKAQRRIALPARRRAVAIASTAAFIVATSWFAARILPRLVFDESLRANEDVTIGSGDRDKAFFGSGWKFPSDTGNVVLHVADGPSSTIRMPLPVVTDYAVTVRLDPYPRPAAGATTLPTVRVFLNGRLLTIQPLEWNPDRFGTYRFTLPQSFVRHGTNTLEFMNDGGGFAVWYLRVHPGDHTSEAVSRVGIWWL